MKIIVGIGVIVFDQIFIRPFTKDMDIFYILFVVLLRVKSNFREKLTMSYVWSHSSYIIVTGNLCCFGKIFKTQYLEYLFCLTPIRYIYYSIRNLKFITFYKARNNLGTGAGYSEIYRALRTKF